MMVVVVSNAFPIVILTRDLDLNLGSNASAYMKRGVEIEKHEEDGYIPIQH